MRLYPFQEEGIAFLNSRKYSILADEMGLGKTIQAIYALMNEPHGVIIVCPPFLIGNWLKELSRINHGRKVVLLNKSNTFYSQTGANLAFPEKDEIYLCGYTQLPKAGGVPSFSFEIPKKPVVVIADEAQYLKNSSSARTKSFRALIKAAMKSPYSRIWLLSGTPILNKPTDLWALVQALNYRGKVLFENWNNFVKLFNGRKEEDKYGYEKIVWGLPNKELYEVLSPYYIRRTKQQVLPDLPKKTVSRYYIKGKKFLTEEDYNLVHSQNFKARDLSDLLTRAKEQSYYKYLECLDLIEQYENTDTPLVVFSNFVRPIEELGGKPGWGAIYGAAPMTRRQEIINDFQEGKINFLAGTIDCLGTGYTLTRASNALFIDLDFTPANNWQAEDRLLRIGQENAVNIIQVVNNDSVDRRINQLVNEKIAIIEGFNRVMDNVEEK